MDRVIDELREKVGREPRRPGGGPEARGMPCLILKSDGSRCTPCATYAALWRKDTYHFDKSLWSPTSRTYFKQIFKVLEPGL